MLPVPPVPPVPPFSTNGGLADGDGALAGAAVPLALAALAVEGDGLGAAHCDDGFDDGFDDGARAVEPFVPAVLVVDGSSTGATSCDCKRDGVGVVVPTVRPAVLLLMGDGAGFIHGGGGFGEGVGT